MLLDLTNPKFLSLSQASQSRASSQVVAGWRHHQFRLPHAAQQIGWKDLQRPHAVSSLPLRTFGLYLGEPRLERRGGVQKLAQADRHPGTIPVDRSQIVVGVGIGHKNDNHHFRTR